MRRHVLTASQTLDILNTAADRVGDTKYNLLLDKGTFDAISLMEDFGSTIQQQYLTATSEMLEENGLFLIATCNWTREEIIKHMEKCNMIFL